VSVDTIRVCAEPSEVPNIDIAWSCKAIASMSGAVPTGQQTEIMLTRWDRCNLPKAILCEDDVSADAKALVV
jgi:hypothetical protein